MQNVVQSVFVAVLGVTVTLLTLGLTGVITLIATDRDTSHGEPRATGH